MNFQKFANKTWKVGGLSDRPSPESQKIQGTAQVDRIRAEDSLAFTGGDFNLAMQRLMTPERVMDICAVSMAVYLTGKGRGVGSGGRAKWAGVEWRSGELAI